MTSIFEKYGRHYSSLFKLAVPIIIGQLGAIVTGLADTIMVGQHSTNELAASSFVNNVLNAFIIFGTGLCAFPSLEFRSHFSRAWRPRHSA